MMMAVIVVLIRMMLMLNDEGHDPGGGLPHVAGAERSVRQRLAVRRGEARVLAHQHAALEQAVGEVSPLRIPPLLQHPTRLNFEPISILENTTTTKTEIIKRLISQLKLLPRSNPNSNPAKRRACSVSPASASSSPSPPCTHTAGHYPPSSPSCR